ncbi:MipA/OmpV family protein [Massilia sp. CCM 9210]|uniref:MipA/OmpV family protein n=1 Tax=Massilia scottii TaxID=3057166 RepID=UPI00279667DE|nr:MipA/OmpV family protein [Massilia sp. CCM 9210]MDQ1816145.1 MipA/OmpV family protein [Massilia sp. CCM 9210]
MTIPTRARACASFASLATFTTLAACCMPAAAQSPTTQMPEGTTDVDISLIAALVPVSEGRSAMKMIVLPTMSAQWSNGIFAEPGEVGMQLSEDPMFKYGPLLTYGSRSRRADDREDKFSLGIEAGAFANYQLAHNIAFHSSVMYGGGEDRRGVRLHLGGNYGMRLTAHQSLSAGAGMNVVNRGYMQSYFGISPEQAARSGRPAYRAGAGVKDIYLSLRWNVDLSTKYALTSGVSLARLMGSAADSPLTDSPHNAALFTMLTYHW